ncbi:MAG TPA: dephospho-CoA kinase [Bryobacteraceae bacterium]|nr:dephospho-CoA kinase [Bryobacteraceae bacterium]
MTGGLASGKSFVGAALAGMGCKLIEADKLGHQVLLPGGAAYEAVVREFGRQILGPDGAIDRKRLALEVFAKKERLALLNSLVHPAVHRITDELIARYAAEDPGAIVVVEAAIHIETGGYRRFDRLVLVVCEERQQMERAIERGATREEAMARLASQMPLAEKREYADYVIDTSGTKEDTLRQTAEVYQSLRGLKI